MFEHRPFSTLGHADHGWLDARHHFSFAGYHDPARTGWGRLRVWNDDTIAVKSGFPPHPHSDMEIITYVREGAISHRDSLGNEGRTEAGDVQVMSAGHGIVHAEYNLEDTETRLFQIWIRPDAPGGVPSWGTRPFPREARNGRFEVLASGQGDEGALPIRADARVLAATLAAGEEAELVLKPERKAYLVLARGAAEIGGVRLAARDGLAVTDVERFTVRARAESEVLVVDTAA